MKPHDNTNISGGNDDIHRTLSKETSKSGSFLRAMHSVLLVGTYEHKDKEKPQCDTGGWPNGERNGII